MDNRPDLPRALARRKQVVLDLVTNGGKGISVHQTKVREEHSHKDRAPDNLIKGDLLSNRKSIISWNELVQPVVEVVSRGSVVEETKGRESDESLNIERSSRDENLQDSNNDCEKKRRYLLSSRAMLIEMPKVNQLGPVSPMDKLQTFGAVRVGYVPEPKHHPKPNPQGTCTTWPLGGSCQGRRCRLPIRGRHLLGPW